MGTLRPFALVDGGDAWLRAGHQGTFLELEEGVVSLAWRSPEAGDPAPGPGALPGGLAFDGACRLYRALPHQGRVLRHPWSGYTARAAEGAELFAAPGEAPVGDFAPERPEGALQRPVAVAVDVDDRLYVAEHGRGRVLIFDLWSRRLLRAVVPAGGARPLDLAAAGRTVWVVLSRGPRLVRLTARGLPAEVRLPPEAAVPDRVAVSPSGTAAVLVGAGTDAALLVPVHRPSRAAPAPGATDLEWESDDVLVAARGAEPELERFRLSAQGVERIPPLMAWGYDGRGIARGPEGRIAYWSAEGLRAGAPARVRYARSGRVTTFRLDAGEYQAEWGRVFLDACIPTGAAVRLACLATDDCVPNDPPGPGECVPPDATFLEPTLAREHPREPSHRHRAAAGPVAADAAGVAGPRGARLAPPAPARERARAGLGAAPGRRRLRHLRDPRRAGPGRFLWVMLELAGNGRVTPRVRSLRVERPGHGLMKRLPRAFSRDAESADFLRRFLAISDSLLADLENRAADRHALLDPRSAPAELLPWLASFVGLTRGRALARRGARRTLVAEAVWLFRFRGTIPGLARFLEIYLEGSGPAASSTSGCAGWAPRSSTRPPRRSRAPCWEAASGWAAPSPSPGRRWTAPRPTPSGCTPTASRCWCRGPSRPSRSRWCGTSWTSTGRRTRWWRSAPWAPGMRVGGGCTWGSRRPIGPTAGFRTLELGGSALGRDAVLGRPEPGTFPESGRLGLDSRVG
jgi:phage tail-like protein